jgi:SAM-dependent MidA family methyltransferase
MPDFMAFSFSFGRRFSQPKCHTANNHRSADVIGDATRATGVRSARMPGERSMRDLLRNLLQASDLSFRDFMELALYHPELGYYSRATSPVGKEGDYVTSPVVSDVFAFALGRLCHEFLGRVGDGPSSIVDVGCGDGRLIRALAGDARAHYAGVDRSLERTAGERDGERDGETRPVAFVRTLDELPRASAQLVFANELFDAQPFARLVRRGDELHELWVADRDGALDWSEHEAEFAYADYFEGRGIELADGQFADISLEWSALYDDLARFVERGLLVTFDYGFPQKQLFDRRIRRFGTAAAYAGQRVSRDLLADPGEQDLTAHINFDDLIRAGERRGLRTLFFDRQAKFLLALGITEHPLFRPSTELEIDSLDSGVALLDERDAARRLVLPDGIGEDIRVLVQGRGVDLDGWSFGRKLFG